MLEIPFTTRKSAPVTGTLVPNPASLDFGSTSTSTPATKTVTLKNTGAADITIMQAPITPSGTAFALVTAVPFTVPGNGQPDLSIKFAPTAGGPQSAALAVGSLSIALTGTGAASSPSTTTLLLSADSNTFVSSVGLAGGAAGRRTDQDTQRRQRERELQHQRDLAGAHGGDGDPRAGG